MRLTLNFRDVLGSVAGLVPELDQMVSRINQWSDAEHDPQTGAHTAITADSISFNAGTAQFSVGAAGSASALPATPSLYQTVLVNGVEYVMPLYAKD